MVVYCVNVYVKEGFDEDFLKATLVNHRETRKEKGNLRCDVLQSPQDKKVFLLYEVYRSDEAVDIHKTTKHYKKWRETVAPWMDKDRVGIKFNPLAPTGEENW